MVSPRTGFPSGISLENGIPLEGAVARSVLRIAADVVEAQLVTIGSDVYEVAAVNDDTTDNTTNSDFNNASAENLFIRDYTVSYPNSPTAVGQLIRVESEVFEVVGLFGSAVELRRGVSGTTVAAHSDPQDIIEDATPPVAGRIAVGLNATFTPAVFTPAFVADVNNRGKENVTALQISVNEVIIHSADSPGGAAAGGAVVLATTETLAGTNNEFDTAAMRSGTARVGTRVCAVSHLVDATEVALGAVRLGPFPFTPVGFILQVYDANGLFLEGLSDQFVISGDLVVADGTGSTNPAAAQLVQCLAWG